MDSLVGLLCFLFSTLLVLGVVAVVGHGLWLMAAAVLGGARPHEDRERRFTSRRTPPFCIGCGERFPYANDERCPACGLDPVGKTADELRDLEAATRAVQRLRDEEILATEMCEQIYEGIETQHRNLMRRRRRKAREVSPEPAPSVKEPVTPAAPEIVLSRSIVVVEAPVARDPAIPSLALKVSEPPIAEAPVAPATPRRSFAEWIGVFMEESNILWGELIGGTLIVGCSIALVLSLWQRLEQIPFFPFLIFAAITSALFSAGLYTLHHWKLESTSRGLLLIGTLLVPLNFLVLAGLSRGGDAGILDYVAGLLALAVFGWFLHRSSRILIETPLDLPMPSAALVTIAMLVSALAQLFAPRWLDHEQAGSFALYVLTLLPVLAQVGAMGWLLFRLRSVESWSIGRLAAMLIALGSITFACGVTLCFPLYQAAGNLTLLLPNLAPAVTLLGIPILLAGTLIHQKLTPLPTANGLWRTLGTGLALLGLFVMFGGYAISLRQPTLRWLSGLINLGTLLAIAWALRLSVLHIPAQLYLATLVVIGWHLDLDAMMDRPLAALRLSGLLVLQAIIAEMLIRWQRPDAARYYAVGSAVSTVLAGVLILPFAAAHPGTAALVLAIAALTWLGANLRWRHAEITYACSAVLAAALFFTVRLFDDHGSFPQQLLWCSLTHATICLLAAMSLRFAPALRDLDWLRDPFHIPLQLASLFATLAVAALLIVQQFHDSLPSALSSIACGWLALLWLTLAVHEGWPALFGGFQAALGCAWFFGASAWLTGRQWDWLEPHSLHIYAIGLGVMSLGWELARIAARRHPRASALLSPPFVPVDRVLTGTLVLGQYALTVLIVLWGVGRELSFAPDAWRVFPVAWHEHAYSLAAWLLPLLLAGVMIVWMRTLDVRLPMLGITLLFLTIPLLIAGAWFDRNQATASAARWGLAFGYGLCSLLLWNRQRLGAARAELVPVQAIRGMLIAGAVMPVLFITLYVVTQRFAQQPLPGPIDGIFLVMRRPASLLIPLAFLSATLAGHGFRERLAYYLLAAGVLAELGGVGGYALVLRRMEIQVDEARIVEGLLLAAGIAWLWSIVWARIASWLEKDDPQPPLLDSPLLTLNCFIGAMTYGFVLIPALVKIVFDGGETGRLWMHSAGSVWGWLVFGVMASGACFLVWQRRTTLPLHLLGVLSLTAVAVIACTIERQLPDHGFRALMFLGGLYACVWVWANLFLDPADRPRWLTYSRRHWESVIYAVAGGALAVLLGSATVFTGKEPIWSAQSIVLVAVAGALLAYQRKTERWASLAVGLMILASTIVVLHLAKDDPQRLLLTSQVDLAVLGAMALLWLGSFRFIAPAFSQLSELRQLPAQIMIGLLANVLLLSVAAISLAFRPNAPEEWRHHLTGVAGWAALVTNGIAAVWYVSAVRPPWVVHAIGVVGLLLGVVFAGSVEATFDVAWLGHHVLTLSWTLLGLTLLIISWASHAHSALGPRFWPIDERMRLTDFLRRCLPEAPARCWATLCGALVVTFALDAAWLEPSQRYWSIGNTFSVSILLGVLAIWSRAPTYVYSSGLLFNVIGVMVYSAWHGNQMNVRPATFTAFEEFYVGQILSFGLASVAWSLIERYLRRSQIDLTQEIALPFTQFALLAGIFLSVVGVVLTNGVQLGGEQINLGATLALAWLALGVLVVAALVDAWRPLMHRFTRLELYLCGLAAIALLLQSWHLSITHWYLAGTLLLAGYVLLIVVFARFLSLESEASAEWFWNAQLVSIGLVVIGSVGITLTYASWQERFGGACASLMVAIAAFLLVRVWPRVYAMDDARSGLHHRSFAHYLTLSLGVIVALEASWACIDPTLPAIWLQRNAATMAIVLTATLLYRFVLPRGIWGEPSRSMSAILGVGSAVLLMLLLGHELVAYDKDARTTPLLLPWVLAAGAAILGISGLSLYSALTKSGDLYGIENKWRSSYVYLTELFVLAFLMHVRLNVPDLIPPVLGKYWFISVMVLAFLGVALGEYFTRKQRPILATPLKRSAVALAFLPVLAFRLGPITDVFEPIRAIVPGLTPFLNYLRLLNADFVMEALCWLLLGLFFGWLARLHRSVNLGIFGALAVNFGVWVLLGQQDATTFLHRPQLWLIPLGLIVLVAEHINRARLGFWPSLSVRYVGLLCIYLSSTIEMFKDGLVSSVILPIALAVLAVAGMLLGILLQVRAFLVAGLTALLVVVFAQIWHAATAPGQTWIWWASGIILGVAILSMFALFEKHRNEVLKLLDDLKRWN